LPFHVLPAHLAQHVIAHEYYPYFGRIDTAAVATVGINCGPAEGNHDRLNFAADGLNLTLPLAQQAPALQDTLARPMDYFAAYMVPQPDRSWNHFNVCGAPAANALHSERYFDGQLAHVDVIPWTTKVGWSEVDAAVRNELLALGRPVLVETLAQAAQLECLVVRGTTAATALAASLDAGPLNWEHVVGNYNIAEFDVTVNGRNLPIPVVAINQFGFLNGAAAAELIARVNYHIHGA
jgi:hypothetical protein